MLYQNYLTMIFAESKLMRDKGSFRFMNGKEFERGFRFSNDSLGKSFNESSNPSIF